MKEYKHAITHPGKAHADDFLSACVLFASGAVDVIYRRDPTLEEIQDPDILVFDQGGYLNPDKGVMDHHQDQTLPCALVLVLEHITGKCKEEIYKALPWVQGLSVLDTQGPVAFAKFKGHDMGVGQLLSLQIDPIGRIMIELAGSEDIWVGYAPDFELGPTMRYIGQMILDELRTYGQHMDVISKAVRFDEVNGESILMIPGITDQKTISMLNPWKDERFPHAAVSMSPNPRGGLTLYRFNDHPAVDFRRVKDDPRVSFAHANGFMCVVGTGDDHQKKETWDDARELLKIAIQTPVSA